ncbi:hypothetical protein Y032_0053g2286 [Ancylostoma ceylanicum]|uniref:EndoU domain-containing protein n=1 Tax=Ancylostoma ceylanicum TaxID=53326 RepID=A0A016U758_9BILA|nr:hypothetical protein Y032_0053g2286 [Ancylostoma ceylanicum]
MIAEEKCCGIAVSFSALFCVRQAPSSTTARLVKKDLHVATRKCCCCDFLWHPFAQSPYIFRAWIEHLWFRHYSRSRGWAHDSSAFEHVFMGEEKRGEVSGFHNWVRFYLLERNPIEELDYMGFIEGRGNVMVSLRFTWQGLLKRVGSFMVGTSPEFEMALYTLCFLARRGGQECTVEIDGCLVIITSYDMVQDGEIFIGTAYPKAGAVTNTCGNFYRRGY